MSDIAALTEAIAALERVITGQAKWINKLSEKNDKLEKEKDALEEEKDALEERLDAQKEQNQAQEERYEALANQNAELQKVNSSPQSNLHTNVENPNFERQTNVNSSPQSVGEELQSGFDAQVERKLLATQLKEMAENEDKNKNKQYFGNLISATAKVGDRSFQREFVDGEKKRMDNLVDLMNTLQAMCKRGIVKTVDELYSYDSDSSDNDV